MIVKRLCKGCGTRLRFKPTYNTKNTGKTRCKKCRVKTNHRKRSGFVLEKRRKFFAAQRQMIAMQQKVVESEMPRFFGVRDSIMGKSYALALVIAKTRGYKTRVVHRDGQDLPTTPDFDLDRLNVKVVDDTVTEVFLG